MKLIISAKMKYFATRELFQFAKQVEVDGLDYVSKLRDLQHNPADILALSVQYALPILSVHQPLYLVHYSPSILFQRMIAVARFFPKVDFYALHLSTVINRLQQENKKIVLLAGIAKASNISIGVESNPPSFGLQFYPKVTYDPDTYAAFCIHNNLKMTLDTSHIAAASGDIIAFYKKYQQHIIMIHLSDFHNGREHLPLGEGSLPIKQFLQAVRKTQYDQKILLEINQFPNSKNKNAILHALEKSVMVVKNTA